MTILTPVHDIQEGKHLQKTYWRKDQNQTGKKFLPFVLDMWWNCQLLPESTVRPGQRVYTGAIAEFKFAGTFYEAEVLKVSGECSYTLLDL